MSWTYTVKELAKAIGVQSVPSDGFFHAVSTDSRTLKAGSVFFALKGERFDGKEFVSQAFAKGATAAVTTEPNPDGLCLVVDDPLAALQQFAAYHRKKLRLSVIAITGSCGKTTTKDMIAEVLGERYRVVKTKGNLNNEIGCPLSLLEIDDRTEKAVIEMGASHPGDISELCRMAQPTESAVTLVAPAHLEGFGSIQRVAETKAEIVEALPPDGVFYVNMDDEWCVRMSEKFLGKKIRYGTRGDIVLKSFHRENSGEMRLVIDPLGEMLLPLPSSAHITNVLLAVAVGMHHGVGMRHGVCDTPRYYEIPLRRALENSNRFKVSQVAGVEIIDDTYNANPASMRAALKALAERAAAPRIAVLGDMLELGEQAKFYHRQLGREAANLGIDCVFVRGSFAEDVVAGAREEHIRHAEVIQDPQELAHAVYAELRPGGVVLVKGSRSMKMEDVVHALRTILLQDLPDSSGRHTSD